MTTTDAEAEAIRTRRALRMARLVNRLADAAHAILNAYEEDDAFNEEQPQAETAAVYPASIDEWLFDIIALRDAWADKAGVEVTALEAPRAVRIETEDGMGNRAYFHKTAAGWRYSSSSSIPLAVANWAHGNAQRLTFALADAETPEAALRAVKDYYHSGPARARARLV